MMKKDELTSRERIRLALNHQETDHVPMDLGGSDCTTITVKAYVNLKEKYGDRIVFWGGIDTQCILPKGTPAEVQEETLKMLRMMGSGGGYVVAAVHNVQPDTPTENILAMLDTAFHYRH
jgi:uroporphyrinogen decarboxylase